LKPRGPGRALLLALCGCVALGVLLAWLGRPQPRTPGAVAAELPALDSAYLWQRRWSPEVLAAVRGAPGVLAELRVLALEIDAAGVYTHIPVDLAELRNSRLRIVPVVRIDGRRPPLAATELASVLVDLTRQWSVAGLPVAEIELDHDCARAALEQYADWLALLRTQLPADMRLALTGLPDWLHSPHLHTLLERVDAFTLQVHAVDRPEAGLFDPGRALAWARRFNRQYPGRSFHLALPTYAARIRGRLFWADPDAVAALVGNLRSPALAGLAGVRWFRLPLPGATNTWSPATLAALIQGRPRPGALVVRQTQAENGALDIALFNPTVFDWPLPAAVRVRGSCLGDATAGFRLDADAARGEGLVFLTTEADRLAPARQRVLGWLRCTDRPEFSIDGQVVETVVEQALPASE
jgi:hypothetical protein